MKLILIGFALSNLSLGAATYVFSDSVDVISAVPPAKYFLDASPYANSVIGTGVWEVVVNPFSPIGSFEVSHYISFFGDGVLESVKVYGSSPSDVYLIANPGLPTEQTFLGSPGALSNEYIYVLSGFDLNQGGTTLIAGFTSINTINFSGSYTQIPEPTTAGLFLGIFVLTTVFLRWRIGPQKSHCWRWGTFG